MKFKVGDIIEGKANTYMWTDARMTKAKVIKVLDSSMIIKVIEHEDKDIIGMEYTVPQNTKDFKLINSKPTKQELLDMPAGTKIYTNAEDEDYQVWIRTLDGDFYNEDNDALLKYDINNDLTLDADEDYGTKIIKIEKPTYETIYDYSTEVQEMTVAEIEKVLGHAVKIIKEDN